MEEVVQATFDKGKNPAFLHGEAAVFVLLDEAGLPAGRVAAFIDYEHNKSLPYPIGGLGFFECVDNSAYAQALFEKAESWLASHGAEAAEGPVNFGQRDKFWGLLVKGFFPPLFEENYQPDYYRRFFNENAYMPYDQVLTLKGLSADIPIDRLRSVAQRIRRDHRVDVITYQHSRLDQLAQDFCEVYNASFRQFEHFKPMQPQELKKTLHQARVFIDPDLLCMAYFDGKPAGFCLLFPDINPLLKPLNGKSGPWHVLYLFLQKSITKHYRAKGIGFGIHPDYRNKGIFAIFMDNLVSSKHISTYPEMYLTSIRSHNKEILSIYDRMGVCIDRVHWVYRKALKEGLVVEPFDFMEV